MAETKRTVNLKGEPMVLAGPEIKVGQKAPDFKLLAIDSTDVKLSQSQGKVRLLSVVHSLIQMYATCKHSDSRRR